MAKFYENVGIIKLIVILLCLAKFQYAAASCDSTQWSCDDGSCIAAVQRCDGSVDCADRSDEIAENCIHLSKECPSFAFTCSYGACIGGRKRCNAIQDCADNSDEMVCSHKGYHHLQGQCGYDQMQCRQSKECISLESLCDGPKDCLDGSDETVDVCAAYPCFPLGFQCGYGACLNSNAKCNGTAECADASDEAWQLCGTPRKTPAKRMKRSNENGCQIPENLEGLMFKHHPTNGTITAGSWIQEFDTIHIECANSGVLVGASHLLCENGKFKSEFPTCSHYCNKTLLEGISTIYQTYINGGYVEPRLLTSGIPSNAHVELSCAPGFKRKDDSTRQMLRCLPNGTFDHKREPCVQHCGRLHATSYLSLTKYRRAVKPNSAPWHVSIHELDDGQSAHICAGTIVSPSIVISAAHCFWDNRNILKKQPQQFKVIAGKFNKELQSNADERSQMRDVEAIHIPQKFEGLQNMNLANIAVIKLKSPLIYNDDISAVCMPETAANVGDYINSDLKGIVARYGQGNAVEEVAMITQNLLECRKTSEGLSLTDDKFCLHSEHDAHLCRGDSGAGFVTKTNDVYKLLGVVSHASIMVSGDCARGGFVAATNVQYMPRDLRAILSNEILADMSHY